MPFSPLPKEDLEHVIAHTRPLWEQLRGGRVFVTGATGFFGIWLLETFTYANQELGLGAKLVGLSRNPQAFYAKAPHLASEPSITLHYGDVRDFQFPEGPFTHVIHAGNPSSLPVPPSEMLDTIISGTQRTLDFAVASGAKRFLFVSSGAVYGKQPPDMTHIPESYQGAPDPMDPNSAYGEGKRIGELLCSIAHREHGLETTIARCFAFVGPCLPLTLGSAIGNFIGNAQEGSPILIKGDGSPFRSYLYAADLAIWLWTILLKGHASCGYNVGSSNSFSIKKTAITVGRLSHPKLKIVIAQQRASRKSAERYVPDVIRAERELGLKEWIDLSEGIQRTMQWNKNNESI